MANGRLRNGVGSQCFALKRSLHLPPIINAKYPNATSTERLELLLAIRCKKKTVNNRSQWAIISSDDFHNVEIYCVEKCCKVGQEGPPESYFQYEAPVQEAGPGVETVNEHQVPTPARTNDRSEDIATMRALNFNVNDNNNQPQKTSHPQMINLLPLKACAVNGKVLLVYVQVCRSWI